MKYFKRSEFTCKCGCGLNIIQPQVVKILDLLRGDCKFPFVVTSGCRCETHNKNEGGSKTSDHLTGEGVDIRITSSRRRYKLLFYAVLYDITRIGIGKSFIHLGFNDNNAQEVTWIY